MKIYHHDYEGMVNDLAEMKDRVCQWARNNFIYWPIVAENFIQAIEDTRTDFMMTKATLLTNEESNVI